MVTSGSIFSTWMLERVSVSTRGEVIGMRRKNATSSSIICTLRHIIIMIK